MDGHLTWYAARASGLVAWGLVLASIVWGLLLATRVLGRRPTPAWLLSLHRYLGALAVAFVGVHVGAILLDSYTSIGVVNVLVPFTGSWDPVAVAWGIVGMYLLLAIEITSLMRDRLSVRAWRNVHLLSYFLFATATVHMVMAGTDVKSIFTTSALVFIGAMTVFGTAALYLWRSEPRDQAARRAARTRVRDDDGAPAEHARADEQERHDGERQLERVARHADPQRHADPDGHEPCRHRSPPGERRRRHAGDEPARDEAHGERPQHADEAGAVAPGVMGPASDRHEHQQHREIGGGSRPHRNASLGHRRILPRLGSGADVGDAFGPSECRRDRHRGR